MGCCCTYQIDNIIVGLPALISGSCAVSLGFVAEKQNRVLAALGQIGARTFAVVTVLVGLPLLVWNVAKIILANLLVIATFGLSRRVNNLADYVTTQAQIALTAWAIVTLVCGFPTYIAKASNFIANFSKHVQNFQANGLNGLVQSLRVAVAAGPVLPGTLPPAAGAPGAPGAPPPSEQAILASRTGTATVTVSATTAAAPVATASTTTAPATTAAPSVASATLSVTASAAASTNVAAPLSVAAPTTTTNATASSTTATDDSAPTTTTASSTNIATQPSSASAAPSDLRYIKI